MNQPVLVVGGGWAGISAALTLLEQNIPVTLIESAPQLGGRARTISFTQRAVDNGQHLMIGAYHTLKKLLGTLNITESEHFLRTPLKLDIRSKKKSLFVTLPKLSSPMQMIAGLVFAKGLSLSEKARALTFCYAMHRQNFELSKDISVTDLLKRHHQPETLINYFWEPICLATLSTEPSKASAQVFLTVLRDSFTGTMGDSDFLFPRKDLSAIYPTPGHERIIKLGGKILTQQRATHLLVENGVCHGVSAHKQIFRSQHTILATPIVATRTIISDVIELEPLIAQLDAFEHEPITTIYCQYPDHITLNTEMVGLVDAWSQWVFDRQFADQPGLMAVVISGFGPHMEVDNQTLIKQVVRELHEQFPLIPVSPLDARVIREKRGAFSCHVGIQEHRPNNQTALPGLWLAGDYTNTDYPATLEGAIRSGLNAAHELTKDYEYENLEPAIKLA